VRTLGDFTEYFINESKFYLPVMFGVPAIVASLWMTKVARWEYASASITNRAMASTISSPARNSLQDGSRRDLPGGGCFRCCP
jgi:hypothetical protein